MSKALIDAAASYYGMDPEQLAQGAMSTNSEGLRFTFIVQCKDDDYLGIADRMRAMREPIDSDEHSAFVQLPTVQEVMADPLRYKDRPECADVLARAAQLSKRVARLVGAEPDPHAATEGVGGRAVKHVDVPVEEDSALPAAVWVWGHELDQAQKLLASDIRGEPGHEQQYLVQVAMLTPEQLAKVQ
jgi:hypothetical protein